MVGATGSGNFVGTASPAFTTPNLGVASATSINFGGDTLSTYIPPTTWTPVFTSDIPGNLSVSYASRVAYYMRIGELIFFNFNILFTPTYTTASNQVSITGLPVASTSGAVAYQAGILAVGPSVSWHGALTGNQITAWFQGGATLFYPRVHNGTLDITLFPSGVQNNLIGSGMYYT